MTDIAFTPEQIDSLLQKLSSDDAFRTQFQNNPAAALRTLPGKLELPAELAEGSCMRPKVLASKEAIARDRDGFRRRMTGAVTLQPHLLES